MVGKDEEEEQATETDPHAKKLYVYTHKGFVFEYNGNQVIMNISFMLSLQLIIMYI